MKTLLNSKKAPLLAACLTCLLVAGCSDHKPKPPSEFIVSQMVKAKISGVVGQVVNTSCCWKETDPWRYHVRFPASQSSTNASLLGSDEPIEVLPLAMVTHMRAFELEAVSN
jgi:hypothetical protein